MDLGFCICLVTVAYMVGISLDALSIMFVPDPYSKRRKRKRRASGQTHQSGRAPRSQYRGTRNRRVQQVPGRRKRRVA